MFYVCLVTRYAHDPDRMPEVYPFAQYATAAEAEAVCTQENADRQQLLAHEDTAGVSEYCFVLYLPAH